MATKLTYRPNDLDDWGFIRRDDGSLFAVVRRPIGQVDMAYHREMKTDPFEDLGRRLIASYDEESTYEKLQATERRAADAERLLAEIEKRFPNWRSYRDLLDCIDATLI
jgi:hypothetical protein